MRDRVLDTFAVMAAGWEAPSARAALALASARSGGVPLWGAPKAAANASHAAFAMATAASALDFDDGHYAGGGVHPGSTVVPVLLALAPDDMPVPRFARAVAVGYELTVHAGALCAPAWTGGEYSASGRASAIGAAGAGAAMLGLGEDGATAALRVAWAHAPVATMSSAGAKESIGWAAATAVDAVELSRLGFDPRGTRGPIFGGTPFDHAGTSPLGALGEAFLAGYTKPFPVCQGSQSALEALDDILREVSAREIAEVRVGVAAPSAAVLGAVSVDDLGSAQFSIPLVLGRRLTGGSLGPHALLELTDADRDAARRVCVVDDPLLEGHVGDGYPATVTAQMRDGSHRTRTVAEAIGGARRPLTAGALTRKANECFAVSAVTGSAEGLYALLGDPGATVADLRAFGVS